ncbi:hypothetical protein GGH93_005823, partial [Coemansia aciculifera]
MDFLTHAHSELGLIVTRLVESYTGAIFDSDPGGYNVIVIENTKFTPINKAKDKTFATDNE